MDSCEKVLLIDDDPKLLGLVQHHLAEEGFETIWAASGEEALHVLASEQPSAIILDLMLPGISGVQLLPKLQADWPHIPVVVLTAQGDVNKVVECIRRGAVDYLHKPFDGTRLATSVRNAAVQSRLKARVESLTTELRRGEGFDAIIGESSALKKCITLMRRAASSDIAVLLEGESGTGKEVAARAIHAESARRAGPFVAVNCGAIPEGLIESELFGHEKGSFTGATSSRNGCFEQADGGTIFLDEIGELRSDLQVRLLRVLQEHAVQRVGGDKPRKIDVRVIAATNRDLKTEAADGSFREDLYYRLAVFPVVLPPLKERDADVLLLTAAFILRLSERHAKQIDGVSPEARHALQAYGWPGNVRELENVIERAIVLEDGTSISLDSLPIEVRTGSNSADDDASAGRSQPATLEQIVTFEEQERQIILRALELTQWNVQEASNRLGLGRATIYRKIERYGLKAHP
jgi:DNA-binding NtrC family response regulator